MSDYRSLFLSSLLSMDRVATFGGVLEGRHGERVRAWTPPRGFPDPRADAGASSTGASASLGEGTPAPESWAFDAPVPPSTDGTPSTAYLERAGAFAARVRAEMTDAVAADPLYHQLAASPSTEAFAASRAREIMEALVESERRGAARATIRTAVHRPRPRPLARARFETPPDIPRRPLDDASPASAPPSNAADDRPDDAGSGPGPGPARAQLAPPDASPAEDAAAEDVDGAAPDRSPRASFAFSPPAGDPHPPRERVEEIPPQTIHRPSEREARETASDAIPKTQPESRQHTQPRTRTQPQTRTDHPPPHPHPPSSPPLAPLASGETPRADRRAFDADPGADFDSHPPRVSPFFAPARGSRRDADPADALARWTPRYADGDAAGVSERESRMRATNRATRAELESTRRRLEASETSREALERRLAKCERRRDAAERDARDASSRLSASEEERRAIRAKYVALGDRLASFSAEHDRLRAEAEGRAKDAADSADAADAARENLRRERKRAKRRVEETEAKHARETRELRESIEAARRDAARDAGVLADLRAAAASDKKTRDEEASAFRESLRASERAREEAENDARRSPSATYLARIARRSSSDADRREDASRASRSAASRRRSHFARRRSSASRDVSEASRRRRVDSNSARNSRRRNEG